MTELKTPGVDSSCPIHKKKVYQKPVITIIRIEEEHQLLTGSPAVTPGSSPITVTPPTPASSEEETGEDGTW